MFIFFVFFLVLKILKNRKIPRFFTISEFSTAYITSKLKDKGTKAVDFCRHNRHKAKIIFFIFLNWFFIYNNYSFIDFFNDGKNLNTNKNSLKIC